LVFGFEFPACFGFRASDFVLRISNFFPGVVAESLSVIWSVGWIGDAPNRITDRMPRYVILYHQMPVESGRRSHWDLMLETNQRLRTWALAEPPQPESVVAASWLPDHRLAYLDYEGPVSGNRGTVRHWDEGTYQVLAREETRWQVRLSGRRLTCDLHVHCTADDLEHWTAEFGANRSRQDAV
jgi:hypothetical protein